MQATGRSHAALLLLAAAVAAATLSSVAQAQITTGCTNALLLSFTPCLNFLTGSTNGGGVSPTAGCCKSLGDLITSSSECACLIITGNVPFSLPINRTLALSLPKACKSPKVPLFKCGGTASPLPAPGPVPFGPSLPPLPPSVPTPPSSSSGLPPFTPTDAAPAPTTPSDVPTTSTSGSTGGGTFRPILLPSSSVMCSGSKAVSVAALVLTSIIAAI